MTYTAPDNRGVLKQLSLLATLTLVGVLSFLIYWPGLSGSFLLDDFPNLERLGLLNANAPTGEFWRSVWMGQSGILRRPVSMLSFALQHADWPGNPFAFKTVNLILHITCGMLIYWLTTLLTQIRNMDSRVAHCMALLASMFWLLNPIHVSTTLYVIQRMCQLACLFALLATCLYLKGRTIALQQNTARTGLALMTGSVLFGTLLAALSKENGALLPGLILLLEFTLLPAQPKPPGWRAFSLVCLWLPMMTLALLLAWQFPDMLKTYDYRPFSLTERLLTQPRVLLDYIGKIFLPRPNAYGLFFDDYPVSKSLFEPVSTALCALALLLAAWSGWVLRKRLPWCSFSILWFLFTHLLESTYLPLEIYFEHRNYLPSVSLAIGTSALVIAAWQRASSRHARLSVTYGTLVALAGYGLITANEAKLWGNPVQQIAVWSQAHPHSLRGQIVWGWLLASSGSEGSAEKIYRNADADYPDEPFFMLKGLALRCASPTTHWPSEDELFTRLRSARYSKTVLLTMDEIVSTVESGHCHNISKEVWISALNILLENPHYAPSHYLFWFFRARLLAANGQLDLALQSIDKALVTNPDLSYYTYPIFWLVSAQRPEEASKYLAQARILQASKTIDGILYAPVLDEWESRVHNELRKTR